MMYDAPTLILLDCQHEALTEAANLPGSEQAQTVHNIQRLLVAARAMEWTVVHSRLRRVQDPMPLGLSGDAPISELRPTAREPVSLRRALSAYSDPEFERVISRNLDAPNFLVGFSAPLSVLATTFDAVARGHSMIVIPEAVGSAPVGQKSANTAAGFAFDLIDKISLTLPIDRVRRDWMNPVTHLTQKQVGT